MPSVPPRRVSRRHVVGLAAGILIAALAVLPAVAADGDPPSSHPVAICHEDSGRYEMTNAPETDFYGTPAGHGLHGGDIVPPFVVEHPGVDGPAGFDGRNWDAAGQLLWDRGCTAFANEKKVTICHATSSETNPFVTESPAIENNGDLKGGHLDHERDIIPPYTFIDANGELQSRGGKNWTEEGQAIYKRGCDIPPPPDPPGPAPITPILECVEDTGDGLLAHFGYDNPNAGPVTPDAKDNFFTPGERDRGQPSTFASGRVRDAVQVELTDGAVTWHLTGKPEHASDQSTRCLGSITIVKELVPSGDFGRFDLLIDNAVAGGASAVGDGGTTGTIAVKTGRRVVGEAAAAGTEQDDYATTIACRGDEGSGEAVPAQKGTSVSVTVRRGQAVVCTIVNENVSGPRTVTPFLECVVFDDDGPDVAVWGYRNPTDDRVTIPVGRGNEFVPEPSNRLQPVTFEPGRFTGVVQTPWESGSGSLTWRLASKSVTATATSPRCTATIEVRKVVAPSTDPGRFELRLNGTPVATGGNGTTTGPLIVGTGEGTVSEVAAGGTSLADYDSRVECTRNGAAAVSVTGTTVDGAVAPGDTVFCTFTNTRKGTPPEPPQPPQPPQPPLPPRPPDPPTPPGRLDLDVVKTASPTTVVVGGRITWTMTVTNRSSVTAADVNGLKVDDPRSHRTRLITLRASQGTCRPYTCNLGRLAPGASATVTAVTEATQVGVVVDIVRVSSEEPESNYANNTAAALARVIGPFTPPRPAAVCTTLVVSPRALVAGRSSTVHATVRNEHGRSLAGYPVRGRGPGVDVRGRTDANGVARLAMTPTGLGLVYFSADSRLSTGRGNRCLTQLGILGAAPAFVTG